MDGYSRCLALLEDLGRTLSEGRTMARVITRRGFLKRAAASGSALALSLSGKAKAQAPVPVIDAHAHLPLLKFGGPLAPRLARSGDRGPDPR